MTGPASVPERPRDPGRQPERTGMSWLRTMLVATVVALLAGRFAALAPPVPARLVVTATIFAGWGAVLVVGLRRTSAMTVPVPPPLRWEAPLVTLIAFGYAVLGVALVMLR